MFCYTDLQDFTCRIEEMDVKKLKAEIEFIDKCIFFTNRAAQREMGTDQTMHKQLDRLNKERDFMVDTLKLKSPKNKKRVDFK